MAALVELGPLLALTVALGCIIIAWAVIDLILYAVHHVSHGIPGVSWVLGKVGGHFATKMLQRASNKLGEAAGKVEGLIGWTWNNLAAELRWSYTEMIGLGLWLRAVTRHAVGLPTRDETTSIARTAAYPATTMARGAADVGHRADVRSRTTAQSVATGVLPRLGTLEHELDHVLTWDIPGLRARDRAISDRVSRAWDWIKAHRRTVVTASFVGAVAVALARLGMSWPRCRNWKRIGKHVCGLPSALIEDLLSVAADAFLLRNLCDLLPLIEATAREVAPVITELVLEVEGFICGGRKLAPSGVVASDWQRVASQPSGIVAADLG